MRTIELYESLSLEINEQRYPNTADSCICCNKPTKLKTRKYVHMNTEWEAMNTDDEKVAEAHGKESQGFYPVGSSCAKKMPREFLFTLSIQHD